MNRSEETARRRIKLLIQDARKTPDWFNAWVLFRREIRRFMVILRQSIVSPVLMTLLYFLVFGYSLGGRLHEMGGIAYMDFLTPGLIMMSLINNSFINSAFSFFLTKVHGSVVDILSAPLSNFQVMVAYVGASLVRAFLTSAIIWGIAALFGASTFYSPLITLSFIVITSCAFGLFGLSAAIVSIEFEHVNFVPNFVVLPFTFLGGVFYSVTMLPDSWQMVARLNPFLYMVNGLRFGMTGVSDVSLGMSFAVTLGCLFASCLLTARLFSSGKNLRD